MKTLYLHIGTHKTGTSALQHFLKFNKELLKTKGYTYPLFPKYQYRDKLTERNGLFLSTLYIDKEGNRSIETEKQIRLEGMARIHELFETYDTIILSDEALWRNLFSRTYILRSLVRDSREQGYRLVLVIYLRRQDDFLESMWLQRIKREPAFTMGLADYSLQLSRYMDYKVVLDRLTDKGGCENIIVRRFDEVRAQGGIQKDFLDLIGLDLTDEFVRDGARNTSLYGNTAYIKQVINSLDFPDFEESKLFRDGLSVASDLSKKQYPCSMFSPEERAGFMAAYEESNAELAARYIGDGRPLFSSNYSGPAKWSEDNPYLVEDIIRSFAASDTLLLRQLNQARDEQVRLQQRLDEIEKRLGKAEDRLEAIRHPLRKVLGK